MKPEQTQAYDDALVALLELVWDEGYMSPGWPEEIRMIDAGVDLAGKDVLDLGCGPALPAVRPSETGTRRNCRGR